MEPGFSNLRFAAGPYPKHATRRMRVYHLIAIAMAALLPATVHGVDLYTENYPPFNIVSQDKNTVSGIASDKVRELMRRAGDSYKLHVVPWARSMAMVQSQAGSCMYSTARTPNREQRYQWVGPLVRNNFAIFGRARAAHAAKKVEDLKSHVIGTKRQDASSEYFAALGYAIDPVVADVDNPRKIMRGRFDYWATGELLGLELIREQHLSADIVPLFVFMQIDMYLSCNRGMDKATIERWNQILKTMEQDGTSAAIEKKYPSYRRSKPTASQTTR